MMGTDGNVSCVIADSLLSFCMTHTFYRLYFFFVLSVLLDYLSAVIRPTDFTSSEPSSESDEVKQCLYKIALLADLIPW